MEKTPFCVPGIKHNPFTFKLYSKLRIVYIKLLARGSYIRICQPKKVLATRTQLRMRLYRTDTKSVAYEEICNLALVYNYCQVTIIVYTTTDIVNHGKMGRWKFYSK